MSSSSNPWMERVLAYNRKRADVDGRAKDIQAVVDALKEMPLLEQIKKMLPTRIVEVLEKYGA